MSISIPEDRFYTQTHEWIQSIGDDEYLVGITEHAQKLLGDVVFVELPEVGRMLEASEETAVVESVKAAADIYAPVSGEVIGINEDLAESPALVNMSAYEDGWLYKILAPDFDGDELLDAEQYKGQIEDEAE